MRIRAHHLFCMKGFKGKGYSPYFVRHMAFVITALARGEPVELVTSLDEICSACPHAADGACARFGSEVEEMDAHIMNTIGPLAPKGKPTIGELDGIVADKFTKIEDIMPVCGGCRWISDCGFFQSYNKKEGR